MNAMQKQLPLTVHETRAERLQRLLSGDLGKVVRPASAFSFDEAARKRAAAIARKESN